MPILLIRHVPGSQPAQFFVERPGGRSTPHAEVPSPVGFPVEGRTKSDLVHELRWYLEEFLDYPFSPETEHAERVLTALRAWGEQAFGALFDNREGGKLLDDAIAGGYEALTLQIWSDDARILAWPWEALRDPKASDLAPACALERRLNAVLDPAPIPAGLPTDRVNILLVIARPKEGDIKYRSIARPLIELIEEKNLPAYVHVLRPPTFDRLREHLRERPGTYHLVHFDGHGSYGSKPATIGPHTYGAPEGELLFEDASGKEVPVSAEKLSALLREHKVPAMVLNACRSAMLGEGDADPFASVAASLLKAGTRSVVAMSYMLYVSAAQEFLPAFYGRLFESGNFAEAVRAGRQQMFGQRGRVCVRGRYDLQDWLVPVVYQQDAEALSFAVKGDPPVPRRRVPAEVVDGENPYGFVGRDGAILEIERSLRRPVPAILIHGLGGVGKTTLARGLVQWLAATEGLGEGCFWFSFQEIRSAEYVFNRLGEALCGGAFGAGKVEDKIVRLTAELKRRRFLIVWDNFEVVAGVKELTATLPDADRGLLKAFLQRLRGGKTKILITSRGDEEWLGSEQRRKIAVGGLDREERWEYADKILGDLGISIDRGDKGLVELMNLLDGHPLGMRVVLPRLEKQRAGDLCEALRHNLDALGGENDEALKKLYATLRLVEDVLPEELNPLLVPLGLHERFVNEKDLLGMASFADSRWNQDKVAQFLQVLVRAGLLRRLGALLYEQHPALMAYLQTRTAERTSQETRTSWTRAFVDSMGNLADDLLKLPRLDGGILVKAYASNLHRAFKEAEHLQMKNDQAALAHLLAEHANSSSEARRLFCKLASICRELGMRENEIAAYNMLAGVEERAQDFAAAESWYQEALSLATTQDDKRYESMTYHNLAIMSERKHDLAAAESWADKALRVSTQAMDLEGIARAHGTLATVARRRGDFFTAEEYCLKCAQFAIDTKSYILEAETYFSLALLLELKQDFSASRAWCKKSMKARQAGRLSPNFSHEYNLMGVLSLHEGQLEDAERWFKECVTLKELAGDDRGAANTYQELGVLAARKGSVEDASMWIIKAAAIFSRHQDWEGTLRVMVKTLKILDEAAPGARSYAKELLAKSSIDILVTTVSEYDRVRDDTHTPPYTREKDPDA